MEHCQCQGNINNNNGLFAIQGAPRVKDKAKLAEPIKVNEGEDLVLKVPFSGKPKPKVSFSCHSKGLFRLNFTGTCTGSGIKLNDIM